MATHRTDTVSDLARLRATIGIVCPHCKRKARFKAVEIAMLVNPSRPWREVRFRCDGCGMRGITPTDMGGPEGVGGSGGTRQ